MVCADRAEDLPSIRSCSLTTRAPGLACRDKTTQRLGAATAPNEPNSFRAPRAERTQRLGSNSHQLQNLRPFCRRCTWRTETCSGTRGANATPLAQRRARSRQRRESWLGRRTRGANATPLAQWRARSRQRRESGQIPKTRGADATPLAHRGRRRVTHDHAGSMSHEVHGPGSLPGENEPNPTGAPRAERTQYAFRKFVMRNSLGQYDGQGN
jgi:hypothetical protein